MLPTERDLLSILYDKKIDEVYRAYWSHELSLYDFVNEINSIKEDLESLYDDNRFIIRQ